MRRTIATRTCRMDMLSAVMAIAPAAGFVSGLPVATLIPVPFGVLGALGLGGVALLRIKVFEGGLGGSGWAWSGIVLGTLELLLLSGVMYLFYGDGLCQ